MGKELMGHISRLIYSKGFGTFLLSVSSEGVAVLDCDGVSAGVSSDKDVSMGPSIDPETSSSLVNTVVAEGAPGN